MRPSVGPAAATGKATATTDAANANHLSCTRSSPARAPQAEHHAGRGRDERQQGDDLPAVAASGERLPGRAADAGGFSTGGS